MITISVIVGNTRQGRILSASMQKDSSTALKGRLKIGSTPRRSAAERNIVTSVSISAVL